MPRICGYVETLTRDEVRGWAYDDQDHARPLEMEVLLDGRRVAIGHAKQERADLAGLGIGRADCGFAIPLPNGLRIDLACLVVRAAGTGEALPIADTAGGYEGVLEKIDGRMLSGWAWRCGFPVERTRIVVRHRGETVASGYADDLREDLIHAGIGDGRHGFVFVLRVVDPPFQPETIAVEFEATGAALSDLRPAGQKPIATAPAPPPPTTMRPEKLFTQRRRTDAPIPPPSTSPPKPPEPPEPPEPTAMPANTVPAEPPRPPIPPLPASKAPAPKPPADPGFTLSREAAEALRGSLNLGNDDGTIF